MQFNDLLLKITDNTFIQMFRYFITGGLAFIIDVVALFILTEYMNIYYLYSATIAFSLGLVTTYIFSIFWVFSKRKFDSKAKELLVFILIGLIGISLNVLFIWLFTEYLNLYYLISKIISTIIVFIWNFFAKKIILF